MITVHPGFTGIDFVRFTKRYDLAKLTYKKIILKKKKLSLERVMDGNINTSTKERGKNNVYFNVCLNDNYKIAVHGICALLFLTISTALF